MAAEPSDRDRQEQSDTVSATAEQDRYAPFAGWLDAQLAKLEAQWIALAAPRAAGFMPLRRRQINSPGPHK
jgi:hypothetical protein